MTCLLNDDTHADERKWDELCVEVQQNGGNPTRARRAEAPPATLAQNCRLSSAMLWPNAVARARGRRGDARAAKTNTVAEIPAPQSCPAYLLGGDDLADEVEADDDRVDAEVEGAPHVQRLFQAEHLKEPCCSVGRANRKTHQQQSNQAYRSHTQHRRGWVG